MSTVGDTATRNGTWFRDFSSNNQVACLRTMPQNGLISSISFYVGTGDSSVTDFRGRIWSSGGTILCETGLIGCSGGVASGSGSAVWHTGSVSPTLITSGTNIYIGWSCTQGDEHLFMGAGGTPHIFWDTAAGMPSSATFSDSGTGLTMSGYATFTPAGMHVRRSGAWVSATVSVRRSGAWTTALVSVRRSGAWVAAG